MLEPKFFYFNFVILKANLYQPFVDTCENTYENFREE